jgi:hypothetical protein
MASLVSQVISWPTLAIALLVFGFAPGAVLRLIVLAFPRDDPRRRELLGELYAVPRIERPFWVMEQLEVGLFEGLRHRFARRMPADAGGAVATLPEQGAAPSGIALLVQRAAVGDRWAWERLVDQYARLVWAMTCDFKLVQSDATDVFLATWRRLLDHIDRLDQPAQVGSWLAATARSECVRSLATRNRVPLF